MYLLQIFFYGDLLERIRMADTVAITELKGIGSKTAGLFAKLGVFTIEDLVSYYPRSYQTYREPVTVSAASSGSACAIYGCITSVSGLRRFGRKNLFVVQVRDEIGGELELTVFNQPYLQKTFKSGTFHVFYGNVSRFGRSVRMTQPRMYSPADYEALTHTLHPVYPVTKGLSSASVSKAVRLALRDYPAQEEFLPEKYLTGLQMISHAQALEQIHFPGSEEELAQARKRLAFEEFFFFLLMLRRNRELLAQSPNAFPMVEVAQCNRLIEALPYRLTGGQAKAWKQIAGDMSGPSCMNRLVQGDVGSGKTILAFLALLMAACNGYQGALMAPTEVLASQHMESLQAMIKRYDLPLRPVLLLGSMSAPAKREVRERIASGEANVVIGTHALIQDSVSFSSLGLVITDEQHRFGVRQRETLAKKGGQPHILVMSATPIPRTLAIVLYGDLQTSTIRELPASRLPIRNCVVGTDYRESAYRFMEKEIADGHQVYIICPQVDAGDDEELQNVTEYAETLSQRMGPAVRVSCLHGQMNAQDKAQIMDQFVRGNTDILVSTTVIEVGINVPNATVMMVENAERFGLAQLHQLRGRVGRGSAQSYCIFMTPREDEKTRERLEILNRSNDGFEIASEDLRLRGPGELFGVRQSGELAFRVADIYADADVLSEASDAVEEILKQDRHLDSPGNARIRAAADRYRQSRLDVRSI